MKKFIKIKLFNHSHTFKMTEQILDIHKPSKFGPGTWALSHLLAEECSKSDALIREFKIVINTVFNHLPCDECQLNALNQLNFAPLETTNDIVKWVNDFHNHANALTKKREWTLEESRSVTYTNLKNISFIGRGMWIFIHTACMWSVTYYEKVALYKILIVLFNILGELSTPSQETKSSFSRVEDFPKLGSPKLFFEEENQNKLKRLCRPSSEETLFEWSVDFHNKINAFLGKPQLDLTTAIMGYEQFCGGSSSEGKCE